MRRNNLLLVGGALLVVPALVVVLLWWNGRTSNKDSIDSSKATASTEEPVFLQSHVLQPNAAVQLELSHVDPSVDGWDTEVFSELASNQLKLLAKAVLRPDSPTENSALLRELLHESFSCGTLKPASLKSVFTDGKLVVNRWEYNADNRKPKVYQQYEGFRQATQSLFAHWQDDRSLMRMSFKILGVEPVDGGVSTTLQTQVSGPTSTGFAQQNATWICNWHHPTRDARPRLRTIDVVRFEEVHSKGDIRPLLQDCTAAVMGTESNHRDQFAHGIDYWRDRLDWRLGLDIVGPHGMAIGDVNDDGLDDFFVCEPGGLPNRLFVQQADGTVSETSNAAGVDWLEPATSALFVDMDNDGDQDLLFTSGRYFISCENDGSARFRQRNVISMPGTARSMAAADFNRDGKLDVYVCCHFHREDPMSGIGIAVPIPYHDANNGPPNVLFQNLGEWQYKNVTSELGLDVNNRRFSFAAAWEDYDDDGDSDLYVANDYGRNNLYRNDGDRFVDVAALAGVEDVASGMSVSWGDYNHDGRMDIYVGNMFSTAGSRVMNQSRFRSQTAQSARQVYQRLARGNSLFQNMGDGTFRDVSLEARVNMGRWAWGALFADINNDGWEDILVGNGMITNAEDSGDL